MKGDTQTAYVLALSMDLLTDDEHGPAADRLVQLIRARDWQIWIPARAASEVTHGETRFLRTEDGCAVFTAGSGTHHFAVDG